MTQTNELERELIGQLILKPALIETCEMLEEGLFSNVDLRKGFAGCSSIWEELKPETIDIGVLAAKTGLSLDFISNLVNGNFAPAPASFDWRVKQLKRRRISERILALALDEGRSLVKTGEIDLARLEEIRRLFLALNDERTAGQGFKRLNEIEGRAIEWLWHGRIPLGMISVCAGDPGLGKSFLATWIASRLSVGAPLPGDIGPALSGSTIFLSAEDSPAYALKPRAARNGADLSKIIVLEDSAFDIASDLVKIRAIVEKNSYVRLLIIDPLNSYLGKTDYLKDPDVRAILNPLIEFCEATGIACLAIMHLNKKTDQAGIYRIGGSIAFAGVARSILAVTQDPEEPERRLLRPIKMNYARKPEPLAFRITEDLALTFDDGTVTVGEDDPLTPPSGREAAEGSFVQEWLRDHLAGESVDLRDLLVAAKGAGITRSTLHRAKQKLKVRTRPVGFGKNKTSLWELPDA